jgi:hypothetical protein
MDTPMHNPTARDTPHLYVRPARQSPTLGLATLPSFARALRQRGLIEPPTPGANEAAIAGKWIGVSAIVDAHLRRQAMEQAFAALRGDAE